MKNQFIICCLFLGIVFIGCKEPFVPNVDADSKNLLVVEGFINSGADSTIFNLSRTVAIGTGNSTVNPETGATLTVESETNETFALSELSTKPGTYYNTGLNLNSKKKYKLKIRTKNGSVYSSDFAENKITPAIDKVRYTVVGDKMNIFIDTHDNTNSTWYYKWDYEETWRFYAKYQSSLLWNGKALENRTAANSIYGCYGNEKSSSILLGSSLKLSQDVISNALLNVIPLTSEKVSERYSIIVKQYGLTKQAYEYWQALKRNTESLGSIFDAQPSQLTGNIHNEQNSVEPVIGYVSVGTMQQQRIFILRDDLPPHQTVYPFDCVTAEVIEKMPGDFRILFDGGFNVPITYDGPKVIASSRSCVDCTIRGTTKKPSFW